MRMLSGLQRSPNEFIPVHKHLRSCQQRLTIWDLPEEILIHLLKSLHVKDLLNMRQVTFLHLLDDNLLCLLSPYCILEEKIAISQSGLDTVLQSDINNIDKL